MDLIRSQRRLDRPWRRAACGLCLAAAVVCACRKPVDSRSPEVELFRGSTQSIAAAGDVAQLDIVNSALGARVAVVDPDGLTIWQSGSDRARWAVARRMPGVTRVSLAPSGSSIDLAFASGAAVSSVSPAGDVQPLFTSNNPAESVLELRVASGTAPGVFLLTQQRRAGAAAVTRVLFAAIRDDDVEAPIELASFDATGGQAGMDVCSTDERTTIVAGWNGQVRSGNQVGSTLMLGTLTLDRSSRQWPAMEGVSLPGADRSFESASFVSPGAIAIRCNEARTDVIVRSGPGWLIRSMDSTAWEPPRRVVPFSPGYGISGRTIAVCAEGLVWIDNRMERAADAAIGSPSQGFPWSDSYQGWQISGVFYAPMTALEAGGRPTLLSSEVGRQSTVAASGGSDCLVSWVGQVRVAKAGGTVDDQARRLFVVSLDAGAQ